MCAKPGSPARRDFAGNRQSSAGKDLSRRRVSQIARVTRSSVLQSPPLWIIAAEVAGHGIAIHAASAEPDCSTSVTPRNAGVLGVVPLRKSSLGSAPAVLIPTSALTSAKDTVPSPLRPPVEDLRQALRRSLLPVLHRLPHHRNPHLHHDRPHRHPSAAATGIWTATAKTIFAGTGMTRSAMTGTLLPATAVPLPAGWKNAETVLWMLMAGTTFPETGMMKNAIRAVGVRPSAEISPTCNVLKERIVREVAAL